MRVYHGGYVKIDEIDLSKCLPNKDFGRGFYVTKFRRHAEAWAKTIGARHKTEGVVTEFEFYDEGFASSICKIKRFENYDEQWLDFVVTNRDKKSAIVHDYDIVEGPVADDKIQNRIDAYLEGKISKAAFLEELKYHEPTHQICFCTFNSLQTLDYAEKTPRRSVTDISEPLIAALMLDRKVNETEAADIFFTSKTFAGLSDATTGLNLKPWSEIYEMLKEELKM